MFMFRKFLFISILIQIGVSAMAQSETSLRSSTLTVPAGWNEIKKTEDVAVFRSTNTNQQTTFSILRFQADVSFEEFKKLCTRRIEAEKKEFTDGFVDPSEPFNTNETFGMFFSGGDKKAGRIFSRYLSLSKHELTTAYLESVGVPPNTHLETFKGIVQGLKRK
jgi:hypothetical protein